MFINQNDIAVRSVIQGAAAVGSAQAVAGSAIPNTTRGARPFPAKPEPDL